MKSSQAVKVLSGITIGFSLFWFASHPKSKLKHTLPKKGYKNISLLPNVTYTKDDTVYHFHHWLTLSACYISLLKYHKFRTSHTLHGLLIGSIIQGLLYKDRFQFRYPNTL